MVLQQGQVRRAAGVFDHRLGDLPAGGVTGMKDPAFRVPAFLAQREVVVVFVEIHPVAGQVVDRRRAFADDCADHFLAAKPGSGIEGVGDVEFHRVAIVAEARRQHRGDPALSPGRVGIEGGALGQDDDRPVGRGPDGEGKTGNACADHQEVTRHGGGRMAGEICGERAKIVRLNGTTLQPFQCDRSRGWIRGETKTLCPK